MEAYCERGDDCRCKMRIVDCRHKKESDADSMNESKVVIYKVFPTHLHGQDLPYASPINVVTHADYKALEEDREALVDLVNELQKRLRSRNEELASLKARVQELVEADFDFDLTWGVYSDKWDDPESWALHDKHLIAIKRRRLALEALS